MKRDKRNIFCIAHPFFIFIIVLFLFHTFSAFGKEVEDQKSLPERSISISPEYTSILITKGDNVSLDLNVMNGGRSNEEIDLSLPSIPAGWNAGLRSYSFGIAGVFVKANDSKTITFRADPEEGIQPGEYVFPINAQTRDGKLKAATKLVVTVKEGNKVNKTKVASITTSYPELKGPADGKFEFSIEVKNELDKDAVFNLSYDAPEDWDINFKPAYEEKYFSSLRIKSRQSESMAVVVKPSTLAERGTYPIKIKVSYENNIEAETELTVLLTGTYKMEVGTPDGRLSLNAFQAKESNLSFYIKNTGSAPQNDIKFLSFKPENWKVEFKPEKIDVLNPGELTQVEAFITPSDEALVGDYSVSISVKGEKTTKEMELRVTVKASTVWGWFGIGIIVFVIVGLVALFMKMGRR